MMIFTYLTLAVAVLGTIFGGLLVVSSIMQAGTPEISELSNGQTQPPAKIQ